MISLRHNLSSAFLIAVIYGAVSTIVLSIITAANVISSVDNTVVRRVTGLAAVQNQIREYGFGEYLFGLLPYYILISTIIFIGCAIHGYVLFRESQKKV